MTTWTTDPREHEAVDTLTRFVADLAASLHTVADARYADPSGGFVVAE
ncbi:hypothetical protein ACFYTQ_05200 [Nocardia sp. NPDC004068]